MTDFNLSTGNTQPLNRTGVQNIQFSGSEVQAVPVGIDYSGTDPQLVKADADSATAIHAVGVLLQEEVIDLSNIPSGNYLQDVEEQLVQENKTLVGDRGTVIVGGVELVNDDDDTSFDPGEPVYLAVGGGFTQTKPTGTGEVQQLLGIALPAPVTGGSGSSGGDRIFLDTDWDYSTA